MQKFYTLFLLAVTVLLQGSPELAVISEKEAEEIGIEAYIYGYPLVTMEMTRRVMTNVTTPVKGGAGAPMGQFSHLREYPTSDFKEITAPNADTLYSTAWLNVSDQPYILSLPDEKDRYYLMPMLSAWTNVFEVPGKRTTGTGAQIYAITGPHWEGKLPDGIVEYKSPTNLVWIIGRTYSSGTAEDYKAAHVIQDQYALIPLSDYGKPYLPPKGEINASIDMDTPPRDQVNDLNAGAYFKLMAELLKDNPPSKSDASIIEKMGKIGLRPDEAFDISKMDQAIAKGLEKAPKAALGKIEEHFGKAGSLVNGWVIFTKTGDYGTDYLTRAVIAMFGLGANRPQDAIYPTSKMEINRNPYNGAYKYIMHFDKGQLPPVKGFWSLTLYNPEFFFAENSLNRYSLSPRNTFKLNFDGSIDLYIQNQSPGIDKESNWLPAPKGEFILMLRLYWPQEEAPTILNGTWKPPPVKIVK